MKIKGHTKIELTNIHTGKKEVIEHDNFVTEFASEYFKECGALNTNPLGSLQNAYPLDDLFGGIMLFDSEIDANTDDTGNHPSPIYVPAGVNMTANASSAFQSNSLATELGQYNEEESTVSNIERTYVYDWGTNEGNGDIACVCLTSKYGGYIGAGNATSDVSDSTSLDRPDLFKYTGGCTASRTLTYDAYLRFATIDLTRSMAALLSTSAKDCFTTGKVTLKWYDIPAKTLNPFVSKISFDDTQIAPRLTQEFNITQRGNVTGAKVMCGIGYILLVGSNTGNTSSGSTVYAVKIDKNGTVTEKVYPITSATNSIPLTDAATATYNNTSIISGCIMPDNALYLGYHSSDSGSSYLAIHSYIPTNGVTKNLTRSSRYDSIFGVFNGRILLGVDAWYDPILDRTVKTNSRVFGSDGFSYARFQPCFDSYNMFSNGYNNTSYLNPGFYYSPLSIVRPPCTWLSTINNLDTVVTKTPDKTMKVTYTLSLQSS